MLEVRQVATERYQLLSYIIVDSSTKEALIVDPPHNIGDFIDEGLKPRFLINTHIHPDHTRGNRQLDMTALAHTDENRPMLKLFNRLHDGLWPGKIRFSLKDGDSIHLGGDTIKILHTPGHSPGSICLHWEDNLISGDTLFVMGCGATHFPGGSMAAMQKSLQRIFCLPPETTVWPGHSYGGQRRATLAEARTNVAALL